MSYVLKNKEDKYLVDPERTTDKKYYAKEFKNKKTALSYLEKNELENEFEIDLYHF